MLVNIASIFVLRNLNLSPIELDKIFTMMYILSLSVNFYVELLKNVIMERESSKSEQRDLDLALEQKWKQRYLELKREQERQERQEQMWEQERRQREYDRNLEGRYQAQERERKRWEYWFGWFFD